MKRSRAGLDGALSKCTSLISIVSSSLNMRGVLLPTVVLVVESKANGAQIGPQRADEVPDTDTVVGVLLLLTVET